MTTTPGPPAFEQARARLQKQVERMALRIYVRLASVSDTDGRDLAARAFNLAMAFVEVRAEHRK